MGPGNIGGNRKPKPDPGSPVLIARRIQPYKGAQGLFALLWRNARAVVFDPDSQRSGRLLNADFTVAAITHGVSDKVFKRAP